MILKIEVNQKNYKITKTCECGKVLEEAEVNYDSLPLLLSFGESSAKE